MEICFIEGYLTPQLIYSRVAVSHLPFLIGRQPDADLPIDVDTMSRHHAEILNLNGKLCVKDLNSTNGTYLNDTKITECTPIEDGDIVRLGDTELRISIERWGAPVLTDNQEHTCIATGNVLKKFTKGTKELTELVQFKKVKSILQPIVNANLMVVGYEMLGRGNHALLPVSPDALFYIAEQKGIEVALSNVFLEAGLIESKKYSQNYYFFFNLHPKEVEDTKYLYLRLNKIREKNPQTKLVLEIPEKAVTDVQQIKKLKNFLRTLEIGLAFDDFGAGQARLLELSDASPDILKFDFGLIHNIDVANPARQRMLEILVDYGHDLGIQLLAEGVETTNEDKICRQIGIDLLQGFYYGKPGEVANL